MNAYDELRAADSWDGLEHLVRAGPASIVIFNPAADGILNATHACDLIRKYPSTPFVAYVPLDAEHMRSIALMSHHGLELTRFSGHLV